MDKDNPALPRQPLIAKPLAGWFLMALMLLLTACSPRDPHAEPPLGNPYSEQQRRLIDIRLFNELEVTSRSWRNHTREMRYQLIKGMADEGYELAELTLRLFKFGAPGDFYRFFIDGDAWRRLKVLADQGDASAQCLYAKAGKKWKKGAVEI